MITIRQKTCEKLTRLLDKTVRELDAIKMDDREDQVHMGATTIKTDGFAIADNRDRAMKVVANANASAKMIVDEAVKAVEKLLTDAPDEDAGRYIASIADRSDLKENEIRAALERYSGHAAQHAILAAASRSGVDKFGRKTDVEQALDSLAKLNNDVDRLYGLGMVNVGVSDSTAVLAKAVYRTFAETGETDALTVMRGLTSEG